MSEAAVPAPRRRRLFAPRLNLVLGVVLIAFVAGAALLSTVWTPTPVGTMDMRARLSGPSAAHWLGADHFGRDELTLLLVGARNSLGIALLDHAVWHELSQQCLDRARALGDAEALSKLDELAQVVHMVQGQAFKRLASNG